MTSTRLALVTGASSGIGLELAREFVEHGYDVVMVADDEEIHAAASSLARDGVRVEAVKADLADPAQVEDLVQRVGVPSALVVNAGIAVGGAFVHETSLEEQLAVVDLNVRSAVHLAKRVLPGMVDRGEGRVLFTSSIAATAPGPYQSVYNASKAFLKSFSQALREELKDTGVTVTALMPGPTATRFFERAHMLDTKMGADVKKDAPSTVARDGFEAMMKGRGHVVAGSVANRLQAVAGHLLPDRVLTVVHRRMTKPGTASHTS